MKFRNQGRHYRRLGSAKTLFVLKHFDIANASIMPLLARLCLTIYDFEAHIMLSLCLTFQGTKLPPPVWKKFNFNVAAKCESLLSDCY